MSSVYLCNVTGDGTSTTNAYRPSLPAGAQYACLMIHEAKARAIVVSPDDTLTGTGITKLITGSSWSDLNALARSTNPTTPQRTAVSSWLTANTYTALTAAQVTWLDVIHFIARQVNPAADLALTSVG